MPTEAEHSRSEVVRGGAFPTTQWSLVLQARGGEAPEMRRSMESLCRRYWFPVYAFLRREGQRHHAAEDLTQSFFVHLLSSSSFSSVSRERGRFRTFLLCSLRNFATSEWRRTSAAKRGGLPIQVPLDLKRAEDRFAREPVDAGLTPEQAFDHNWAMDLIQQGVDEVRRDYCATGRADLFAALLPHAFGQAVCTPQAVSARQIGLNEHAFNVAVPRLRKRLREALRQLVRDTLARPDDTDDELKVLLQSVRQLPLRV